MPLANPSAGIKAGTVAHFATSTASNGWLKANGALVSRSAYAALFAAIGTTFGAGDGATTFALPDLRGEFVRSLDDGRGVDSGRGIGTAQGNSIQTHAHEISVRNRYAGGHQHFNQGLVSDAPDQSSVSSNAASLSYGGSETRPRNVAMLACIKY